MSTSADNRRIARAGAGTRLLPIALLAAMAALPSAARAQDAAAAEPAPAESAESAPAAPQTDAASAAAAPAEGSAGRLSAADLVPLSGHSDDVVIVVGEVPLRRSDIYRVLDLATPGKSAEVIRQMVLSTAAQLEAAREGIDVPQDELQKDMESAMAEQKASFALEVDEKVPLEEYLSMRHGISPEDYRAEVRRMVLASLLLERAVRLDQRRMDRDDVAVIVVSDEALAKELRQQLDDGASFTVLAKKNSVHPSAAAGGELPPIPAGDDVPLLAGRQAMQPGELLGPASISLNDKTWWRIVRLIDHKQADAAPWAEVREEIEAGLKDHPLQPDELAIFEDRMVDRYRVSRPPRSP